VRLQPMFTEAGTEISSGEIPRTSSSFKSFSLTLRSTGQRSSGNAVLVQAAVGSKM
jgi:hypothetical protein